MEKKKRNYIKFVRISMPLKGKIDLKCFKSDSAAMGTILLWKRRTTVKLMILKSPKNKTVIVQCANTNQFHIFSKYL